ncbi:hypothetical protein [Faecalispora jeddahensis]|uniref:hypothetical protein n=1 Tax=Faecalispora jeddahensis TaxID=1414721 RepID=UPI00189A25D9|nr:hypothetical protein [Faecalispora jeddahensis]
MDEMKKVKSDACEIAEILKRIPAGDQKMVLGFVKCIEAMRGVSPELSGQKSA